MSRSPHGERGLKYNLYLQNFIKHLSLSSRRAWIEIDFCPAFKKNHISRSPHGERGLKCKSKHLTQQQTAGRSPHGERGLKWKQRCFRRICRKVALLTESVDWNAFIGRIWQIYQMSLSSRRAWIEIETQQLAFYTDTSRSPHGERGLKLTCDSYHCDNNMSLSSRRAWIEIKLRCIVYLFAV